MRDHYDIVIVGGGVIGLTIARALALRGVRDVCLVERGNLGTEASWAAAGMSSILLVISEARALLGLPA